MRALLLHNPTAGSGQPTAESLLGIFEDAGFSTRYLSSKDDDYKDVLAHGDVDVVIVAGGDGTVSKIARNISDREVRVAILPLGTANNVARSLKIEGGIETMARNLHDAPLERLDVGCATGPWGHWKFLESVGWGALAEVVDQGVPDQSRERQIESARELFARILERAKPSHVRIEIDGKQIEGDFILVEILNIGLTGPRVLISPSAKPGDRMLDVVYLPVERKQALIDWLRAEPDDTPIPLQEIKAKKATLAWREGPLRVDDEVFDAPEFPSQIHVEIEPEGLRICVPSREP